MHIGASAFNLGGNAGLPLHGEDLQTDRLTANGALTPGQSLVSQPNGTFECVLQTDGNLVVYNREPLARDKALWATGTVAKCVGMLAIMQSDGNFVVYGPANSVCWAAGTTGKGSVLIMQDDGNLVIYDQNQRPVWSSGTAGGKKPEKHGIISKIGHDIGKIPVVGKAVAIAGEAVTAPVHIAVNVAKGERLDHVAIGALKGQLKIVKDTAPYAETVVSLVPGVGTGVDAAISAGAALAEGQNIATAAKDAIRGALPGGPIAGAAFDTALRVGSGENVAKAALQSSRDALPPGPAQAAFDTGIAVATGEKLQNVLANGIVAMSPDQLQTVIAAGQQAVATTPGLSDALRNVAPGDATRGFHMATGLLAHEGMNERALSEFRRRLSVAQQQGFDAGLRAQQHHVAWLANVTGPAPTATATAAYAPYPQSGALSGCFDDTDVTWGPAVQNMSGGMEWAGRSAVNGSKGRSRVVQGPDGTDYKFSIENGVLTARPRVG
jgi:hypothetical protein